jgi:hypothetical protein
MAVVRAELHFMDPWETLVVTRPIMLSETDDMPFPFLSGCGEERPLVRQLFEISVQRIYGVIQFDNHQGDRCHAEIWASIAGLLLLRLQGRYKKGPTWATLICASPTLSPVRRVL